jgi:toxin-antitoxin system PIN domain toxin
VIVPDVNVLVPLHRPGHVHHERARRWWDDFTSRGEPFTVPDIVWSGFVRIVTHPRILNPPSSRQQAWLFVEAMRSRGTYLEYARHPRLLQMFRTQCQEAGATANLVTDAYIAAVALSLGATIVTFDRDFRRFDGLKVLELS